MTRLIPAPLVLVTLTLACGPADPGVTTDATTDATGTATTTAPDATTTTDATPTDATTTDATGGTSQVDPTEAPTSTTGETPVPCGDVLPPSGSPCVGEGLDCAPDAVDECTPYTGAYCEDGRWVHYDSPGGACPCDPGDPPSEGSECLDEGEFCGSPCEDPCQFCNGLVCTAGVWESQEVAPAPCLDCASVCEFVVAAGCAGGPPDTAACVADCEQDSMGRCALPYHQMLGCIGPEPTFTCDAMDRPVVAGCEAEFEALHACRMP